MNTAATKPASLSRALASFREECCLESTEVGSSPARNMRMLLDSFKTPYGRVCKPDPPAFQRAMIASLKCVSVMNQKATSIA